MKTDAIKKQLEDDLYNVREKYTNIVLNEVINPFCKKYGFKFESGMGCYYFKRIDFTKKIPKSWTHGHYYSHNDGKELNMDIDNKIIQTLKNEIDNIYDQLTV